MSVACSKHESMSHCAKFWSGNLTRRYHMGDLAIKRRKKIILKIQDMTVQTGIIWH
jgi:hypothetical protein